MAISSFNKASKHIRIKISKQEVRSYNPGAGTNFSTYAPETPFTRVVNHGTYETKIQTQNSGIGELNAWFSTSAVHFEPNERRYPEDIERAMEKLNILDEHVGVEQEPNHVEGGKNKGLNLQHMEHITYVDNPTLDAIDKVRSIMVDKKIITIDQREKIALERKMARNPLIYGIPSNAQAIPRFLREKNKGARNPYTGLKEYETEIGRY